MAGSDGEKDTRPTRTEKQTEQQAGSLPTCGLHQVLSEWVSGWLPAGPRAEWQIRQAAAVGEYGRILGCGSTLRPDSSGRWAWPGSLKHGPDDLAAIGGGQDPERA